MTKTDAQYKQNQRLRDKLLLEEIGFNSLEGVMSAIRGLDEHGLKQLQAILRRRNTGLTSRQKDEVEQMIESAIIKASA